MFSRLVWPLLLLILLPWPAPGAPDAVVPLSGTDVLRRFTSEDGLPQNSVSAIVQDRAGYLWLATFGGLVRFDGNTFNVLGGGPGEGPSSNRILSLWVDPRDRLWVGTENAGVDLMDEGRFQSLDVCAGTCTVDGILPAGTDAVLLSTTQGAFLVDLDSLRIERIAAGSLRRSHVANVDGAAWLAEPEGLLRLDGRSVQRVAWPAGTDPLALSWVVEDGDELWFGFDRRTTLRYAPRTGHWRDGIAMPVEGSLAFWRDLRGARWFNGYLGAAHREEAEGVWLPQPDAGVGRIISHLFDDDGTLWLGTGQNGLLRVRRARVELLDAREAGFHLPGMPVTGDGQGGQWFGLICDGLRHRSADGRIRAVSLTRGDGTGCPWSLHVASDGTVWVGSTDGDLKVLSPDGAILAEMRFTGTTRLVRAIHPVPGEAGSYYVAADRSMFVARRDAPGGLVLERLPAIQDWAVTAIVDARAGGVWMVGERGAQRVDRGEVVERWSTDEGLSSRFARSLWETLDGELWIGTYGGGLNLVRNGRVHHFSAATGLFDDVVSCLLPDAQGNLWMSGNRGVAVLPASELERARAGGFPEAIGVSGADGLVPSETNGGAQPACHRDDSGYLWFPLIAGFARIDPQRILGAAAAPLRPVIESVSVAGQRQPARSPLRLPPGTRDLEIGFSAPGLSAPEKLRFRFRLGADAPWTDIATRRSVLYPILPWGEYDFEVEVRNADGVWSSQPARLRIAHPQPWYLLPLVWVLAALAVPPLTFAAVRALRAFARRREAQLVLQRTRELEDANRALAREVMIDPKTGIANHRRLVEAIDQARVACRNAGNPLALLLFDIDEFKRYNDHYGHLAGDECLRRIAVAAQALARRGDVLARFGGEEFALLMPGMGLGAAAMAERLRARIEAMAIAHAPGSTYPVVTISLGCTLCDPAAMPSRDAMLEAADRAMYAAKQRGRNCAEVRPFEMPTVEGAPTLEERG